MRDQVTFIIKTPTNELPAGNFAGYIDHENRFAYDTRIPFPHLRASVEMTQCVLRIECEDHPQLFAETDLLNIKDVNVTDLIKAGTIVFDQYAIPDSSKRQ